MRKVYQNSHLGVPECWEPHGGLIPPSSPLQQLPCAGRKLVLPSHALLFGGTVDSSAQTVLGPGHPLSVLGQATACLGLSFPIGPWGSWWEGGKGSRWEGLMLPASPKRLSSPSSFHWRGNYPLMTENYKRSVWPHAQGPWASREG